MHMKHIRLWGPVLKLPTTRMYYIRVVGNFKTGLCGVLDREVL